MAQKQTISMDLWVYEWGRCMMNDQLDHILDSARDHNIGFVIDSDDETVHFVVHKDSTRLSAWLDSWPEVPDSDNVVELHQIYFV